MEELDKITYDLWDRQARAVLQHHCEGIQRRSHTIYENSEKTAESDGHCPGIKQDHILSVWEHGRVRTTLWTIKQISRIHTICRGTENVAESDRHNVQQMSNKKTHTLCGNGEKLSRMRYTLSRDKTRSRTSCGRWEQVTVSSTLCIKWDYLRPVGTVWVTKS